MIGKVYLDVDDADDLEELKAILREDTKVNSPQQVHCQHLKDFLFKSNANEKSS